MAAGALVGVVTDDRGLGDARVDSPVDPREPRRDLVHGPVQVVDPALQRDGEVDHVLLPPPSRTVCAPLTRRSLRYIAADGEGGGGDAK